MMKVGVFDSGVGGITVLLELRKKLGALNYVYLGDTANVPYGPKSPAQIQKLSGDCARILKEKGVDALVVACNTASSLAFETIQKVMHPAPVFGVVGPGIESALLALQNLSNSNQLEKPQTPVLILATRATVQSHAYGDALKKILGECYPIFEQACPILVPMIEEGWVGHSILNAAIDEYTGIYSKDYPPGVALLACTHYPWIHSSFEKALPNWTVVNSAQAVSESLKQSELIKQFQSGGGFSAEAQCASESLGTVEWIFTDPEAVPLFAKAFIYQMQFR